MAQLTDDCFTAGDGPLRLDEAIRLMGERIAPAAAAERVPLLAADNRVLAETIVAPIDLPPFDNSAVDGYAVRFADLNPTGETALAVVGRLAAGMPAEAAGAGAAVRIFTGAPMPPGLDTVFMQEDVRLDEPGQVLLPPGLVRGANRRRAGEDVAEGALALSVGRRLSPPDLALIGALGLADVLVRRRLRVAVFSTGDEVAPPGARLGPAAIHDANRPMLLALLARLGLEVTDGGVLRDGRASIAAALADAAAAHDLLLTSGGVSVGEEDHVRDAVAGQGGLTFWRLGMKPGRPVAMGVVCGVPFIGLPGNPVAAFVTFSFVARHLIARLAGETYAAPAPFPVVAGFAHRKKAGRREYLRVRLDPGVDRAPVARKHRRDGAGTLASLTETDGLIDLPEELVGVQEGDMVGFLPYASLR